MKNPVSAVSTVDALFQPIQVGEMSLPNRIVMAPLTRNRASEGNVPTSLNATYYAQRAEAGLIVSEATQISPEAQGYIATPGIHSSAQIAGWKLVTDAVHAKGGHIVLQLWHVGRISHVSLQPGGIAPVAPSPIRAEAKTFVESGFVDVSTPRALGLDEMPRVVEDFRKAAANAMQAGFDGVEVHGANGYLLDQFLRDKSNQRTDAYGGSIENRTRLLFEVCEAVAGEVGGGRTGVRLSPVTSAGDVSDSDPQPLFNHVVERLASLDLAYIHVIEGETGGVRQPEFFDYAQMRKPFHGAWIVNNGYDRDMAIEVIASGKADMVAFGRDFLANPDLPRRLLKGASLNQPNQQTFYGGGAKGYTDYPALD